MLRTVHGATFQKTVIVNIETHESLIQIYFMSKYAKAKTVPLQATKALEWKGSTAPTHCKRLH
jgi:hypothetical protein